MFEKTKDALRAAKAALSALRQPGGVVYTGAAPTEAGVYVSEDTAMRFATVHACVRVLAEDVGALPIHVYRRKADDGRERAPGHPLYELLHDRPNPEMSSVQFKEALMVNALLTGNGYAFIEYDTAGRVRALWPLLSSEVTPYRTTGGELRYRAGGEDLPAGEVFHLPGLGFDGLVGLSPIAYARESIGLGQAAEKYGEKFFKNGTHIGGVISMEGELSDDQFERVRTQFRDAFRGLENAHGVPVLEGGAKYTPVGIAPEDAQFLETRKFQRSEIAAIYRVPPHMIGDLEHATFTNIEQQDQAYLQRSLLPWLTRIEKEARAKLLAPEEQRQIIIEHDTANFMRGDTMSRYSAYATAINAGFMLRNEARRRENWNPMPGGDVPLIPLNMVQGEADPDAARQAALRLLEQRDFTTDGSRRAVNQKNTAAQLGWLGISMQIYRELAEAFTAWLEKQADDIQRIVEEETGEKLRARRAWDETTKAHIDSRLRSYYRRLKSADEHGLENAEEKLGEIADRAWRDIAKELGEAAYPDEAWRKGYLERYGADMLDRLCQANYNQLHKALEKAGTPGDLNKLISSVLHGWRKDEYGTCARGENMAKTETAFMRNEALIAGYKRAGYASVWKSAPACCRICTAMNGQTVTNLKPPLHKGCVCTVVRGERLPGNPDNDILFTDKQFGKKIGKHAEDYGLDASNAEDREKMLNIIKEIYRSADQRFTGDWRGQEHKVVFSIKAEDVVITKENGEFVTIMKGGANNERIKKERGR